MQPEKKTETPMTKLARFIVDKRKAFFLIFIAALIFCGASINKVQVNNDITSYLPPETETRRGLTLMDQEFITLGTAYFVYFIANFHYLIVFELETDLIGYKSRAYGKYLLKHLKVIFL